MYLELHVLIPLSGCNATGASSAAYSQNITRGQCTQSIADGTYFIITYGGGNLYNAVFGCSDNQCTKSCNNTVNMAFDTCTANPLANTASSYLSASPCIGGAVDPSKNPATSKSLSVTVYNQPGCKSFTAATVYNFGSGPYGQCVPYIDGQYVSLIQTNSTWSLNLGCPNSSCTGCAVAATGYTAGTCAAAGTNSLIVSPSTAVEACYSTASSSKLSTTVIAAIAAGGAVAVIIIICVAVHLAKGKKRTGYQVIEE